MNRMRHSPAVRPWIALLLVLFFAACRSGKPTAGAPTALPIPTSSAPTATAPLVPAAQAATGTPLPASPTPTRTPIPSLAPTTTPPDTPTPVPEVFAIVIRDFAGIHTGPSEVFEAILTLTGGMAVDLTGRNENGSWLYADLLLGQGGWVSAGSVRIEGDPENLPVLAAPAIPTATATAGPAAAIAVQDLATLVLTGFKLHENVIITVVQVEIPDTAESRNCVITDPAETICLLFNLKKAGVMYRITAHGDQGSFAEITFSIED